MTSRAIEKPVRSEIEAAADRIRDVIVHTPLVPLHGQEGGRRDERGLPELHERQPDRGSEHESGRRHDRAHPHERGGRQEVERRHKSGHQREHENGHERERRILLKPEILQPAGSFKIRGIYHAVSRLTDEDRRRGLSTVSAGNTAKALAWCGRRFGVPARSLMPESAATTKIESFRALGGTPVLLPTAEVFRFLREHVWEEERYSFIHPWTNRDVILGHASLGLEILTDCPEVDAVYVPVGGGGLIAGVASAIKAIRPSVRIVAVEPRGCPSLHDAIRAGRPVTVECNTMCDGVAVPYVTEEMFGLLRDLVDDVVLVSEEEVRSAIRLLAAKNHLVVEGAGALATAAALGPGAEDGGPSVCLVTGGSIDTHKLAEILVEP